MAFEPFVLPQAKGTPVGRAGHLPLSSQNQRRLGRVAQAVGLNCGSSKGAHRATASARAFSLMLPRCDCLIGVTGLDRIPWAIGSSLRMENATRQIGSKDALRRERVRWRLLRLSSFRRGHLGVRVAIPLDRSYLIVGNAERDSLHLLNCPPSFFEINVPPDSHPVNNCSRRKQAGGNKSCQLGGLRPSLSIIWVEIWRQKWGSIAPDPGATARRRVAQVSGMMVHHHAWVPQVSLETWESKEVN
jgi:hypothetical protein